MYLVSTKLFSGHSLSRKKNFLVTPMYEKVKQEKGEKIRSIFMFRSWNQQCNFVLRADEWY